MAERPIFFPNTDGESLFHEKLISFTWHSGFSAKQKMKSVNELHKAAKTLGIFPILETSSKSTEKIGTRLSAFNLKIRFKGEERPIECIFQGSKVFENGGPYNDLYEARPRDAKLDPRIKNSGKLKYFLLENRRYPLYPYSVFYDWLFINALLPHKDYLCEKILHFVAFSDIEFNPNKSINCQARSCAIFVSLAKRSLLESSMNDFEAFRLYCAGRQPSLL